ncbi:MAG: hypothetical protein CMI30_11675 [Opitutae bacterium]|nr:hypothetical protein [Opitutae bacterium]
MEKLNILTLHRLGNPRRAVRFLRKHVFFLRDHAPEHNYVYHDVAVHLPDYVKDIPFDAVILDVTLLCSRWGQPDVLERCKKEYSFVADLDAVRFAFPQDEYDCNELLDDWMMEWKVDVVFSVLESHREVLYPRYHEKGEFQLSYCGCLDEKLLSFQPKPFADRTIDLGYRARKLPPYFGRLGQTKWTIGREVDRLARAAGLRTDVVLGDGKRLFGNDWINFINDCKFTLGANSGSSLLDPRREIQQAVRRYLADSPDATFEEVEAACFPGQEGKYEFTAISPRVLETAALGSGQILVDGAYSGIVEPWEHYLPIRPDASNFDEVFEAMGDVAEMERMIKRCREAILDCRFLRYSFQAQRILDLIRERSGDSRPESHLQGVEAIIAKYEREIGKKNKMLWAWQDTKSIIAKIPILGPGLRKTMSAFQERTRRKIVARPKTEP